MFLFNGKEKHSRSIAKAISWRIMGSIDTFVLSWLFTGNPKAAGAIASTEVFTKIVLYYFHERIWSGIGWGLPKERDVPAAAPGVAAPATKAD
ncbi:DUF2061 domain-containing protein [Novosphingopyxis sp.]|uniref:DUF2061 domain-containing protein n=1 Tax=Novosphingopyxis sp. TaxID=2709690 RepID=UPI003B5B54B9